MDDFENEMLAEARRTTHAVRALARFSILQVTYSVVSAVILIPGLLLTATEGPSGSAVFFYFTAGVVALVGLAHALTAGWSELGKSDPPRPSTTEAVTQESTSMKAVAAAGEVLTDHECECSMWERGVGNTATREGRIYCLRCYRFLSA